MLTINFGTKATYDTGITALRTYLANHRKGPVDITVSAYEGADTLDFKGAVKNCTLTGFKNQALANGSISAM